MNRREFAKRVALVAAATGTGSDALAAVPPLVVQPQRRLIKPARLRQGDLVGLIAPGGVVSDAIIQECVTNLESLGFLVKLSPNIRAARGGYAGTVQQRLDDLHGMFVDRDVKAIWTARGGSGCTGLLPGIRYDLIRRHPKILIGYSDITALHLALHRRAGLVTFHGPVAWSTPTDYAVNQMQAVLMSPRPQTQIFMSIENVRKAATQPEFQLRTLRHGVAEGRLIGGNLSVLSALIGTPYAAPIERRLVFLEETREPTYRIDRMLTQLQQSVGRHGRGDGLKQAAGIMLGVFSSIRASEDVASSTLAEVLDDQFGALPIPAVYGYSVGHISDQFTIPLGIRARLDTADQTLTLLEAAVLE